MKRQPGHLPYVPKQYAWYRDPSSSSTPDILLTSFNRQSKENVEKGA